MSGCPGGRCLWVLRQTLGYGGAAASRRYAVVRKRQPAGSLHALQHLTVPTADQQRLLDLLGGKL